MGAFAHFTNIYRTLSILREFGYSEIEIDRASKKLFGFVAP